MILLVLMFFSVYSTICLPLRVSLRIYLAAYQLESSASKSMRERLTFFCSELMGWIYL